MKKILTFDLDGTLIGSGNKIIGGDKTINLLKEIRDRGIKLVANTGRLDHDITSISEKYNIDIDFRISQNGAVVIDDKITTAKILNKKEALQILTHLSKYKNIRYELNTVSNRYWKTPRLAHHPKEYYDSHIINADFKSVILYQPVVLFLCLGQKEELDNIKNYVNTNFQNVRAVSTSNKSLEILTKDVSKGHTLKEIFPHSYIYGIGDSENDYSVFEISDQAYYVGTHEYQRENVEKEKSIDLVLEKILYSITKEEI